MITLTVSLPETVAAEYFEAADELNRQFGEMKPRIEAKSLMAFALARYNSEDVCAQFDLAMRVVRGEPEEPLNPVLN